MKSDWWLVVQTQPRAETKAVAHLVRQGFEPYLPLYSKRRRHARRVEVVAAPLFPRYLFVSYDSAKQRWRSIRSTVGVSNLVSLGELPAFVSVSVIDAIRGREENGRVKLAAPAFRPGDRVRVTDGPFSEHVGFFDKMRDEERVCVLLEMLGQKVRVTMDRLSLASA